MQFGLGCAKPVRKLSCDYAFVSRGKCACAVWLAAQRFVRGLSGVRGWDGMCAEWLRITVEGLPTCGY